MCIFALFRDTHSQNSSSQNKGTFGVEKAPRCVQAIVHVIINFFFSDDGIFHLSTNLPHSITTWVIQAVGVSNHTGLGVAHPLYIRAFQQFFVSLRVPYSVQRGEQISVIATVFNYGEFNTKVCN